MSGPRILTIMGSGETAPTMAKVHRALFERFGRQATVPAVLIDTPYGFQENADDLSERIVGYFRDSIGRPMEVASWRSAEGTAMEAATALARIGQARYVLAGPGSPSYALRHWTGGPIAAALSAKLADGGAITMASAAALTTGRLTIPVYEIYKVGAEPTWLAGLDLLGAATGLRAAVVPHYDNAEGGNHDTRFCYIGERRLRVLEALMPADTFVLGVDSHTALVLDLDRRTAAVFGLGGVTVRVDGRSRVFPSGTETTIDALASVAAALRAGSDGDRLDPAASPVASGAEARIRPLRDEVTQLEGAAAHALADGDPTSAVGAVLALDETIERAVGAGEDSADLLAARATFRALVVRLGEAAAAGLRDPRETVGPLVEALLEIRAHARDSHDWTTADLVRDRLIGAGIEVHDDPTSSSWSLRPGDEG